MTLITCICAHIKVPASVKGDTDAVCSALQSELSVLQLLHTKKPPHCSDAELCGVPQHGSTNCVSGFIRA